MPTPAKLVAALALAALGWVAIDMIRLHTMPEGSRVGFMREIAAAAGLLVGWRLLGRPATGPRGQGGRFGVVVMAGMAAAVATGALLIAGHSFVTMIRRSLIGGTYTEPYEAVEAWMGFALGDVARVSHPTVVAVVLGGGALAGLMAWATGRVWR